MVTGYNSVSIILSMNQVVQVAFGDGLPVQPADDQQPVQRVDVIPRLLVTVTGSKTTNAAESRPRSDHSFCPSRRVFSHARSIYYSEFFRLLQGPRPPIRFIFVRPYEPMGSWRDRTSNSSSIFPIPPFWLDIPIDVRPRSRRNSSRLNVSEWAERVEWYRFTLDLRFPDLQHLERRSCCACFPRARVPASAEPVAPAD
jgi:hypothetical protein